MMKAVNKKELIEHLEQLVEAHLQQAIRVYQNTDDATLLKPSATGGWSIAQCLEHLNSYGRYYIPQLKIALDKAQNLPDSDTFTSGWLGNYFTNAMDPTRSKSRMKSPKEHQPATQLNATAVVAEFIQQQETLLIYLQAARNVNINAVRIPITLTQLIQLKLGDVLRFVITHNQRHVLQANRNYKS